jgi:hypothetical protein
MTEEEKMVFWGDLVEPITALLGGLLVRGEYKLVDVVKDIVDKAENAALEEREACAKVCDAECNPTPHEGHITTYQSGGYIMAEYLASAIRARGQG